MKDIICYDRKNAPGSKYENSNRLKIDTGVVSFSLLSRPCIVTRLNFNTDSLACLPFQTWDGFVQDRVSFYVPPLLPMVRYRFCLFITRRASCKFMVIIELILSM